MRVLKRAVFLTIGIAALIGALYIFIDYKSETGLIEAYNKVGASKSTNMSNTKKLNFLSTYVKQTGDFSIASEKGYVDGDLRPNGGKEEDTSTGDSSNEDTQDISNNMQAAVTEKDVTSIAKQIATWYFVPGSSDYYHDHSSYNDMVINGITIKAYNNGTYNRVCNGFVSHMLVAMGFKVCTDNFPWLSCADFASTYGKEVVASKEYANVTYGSLEVGDIICIPNHVEIVTKKDNSRVYIAAAGGHDAIVETASCGYRHEHAFNEIINDYYVNAFPGRKVTNIRRPIK